MVRTRSVLQSAGGVKVVVSGPRFDSRDRFIGWAVGMLGTWAIDAIASGVAVAVGGTMTVAGSDVWLRDRVRQSFWISEVKMYVAEGSRSASRLRISFHTRQISSLGVVLGAVPRRTKTDC